MKRVLVPFFMIAALSTGCYRVSVKSAQTPNGVQLNKTAHMFLFGLVGDEVDSPCAPSAVETRQGVIDWFLAGVTLGLYTPYSVTVTCAHAQAALRAPAADSLARVEPVR